MITTSTVPGNLLESRGASRAFKYLITHVKGCLFRKLFMIPQLISCKTSFDLIMILIIQSGDKLCHGPICDLIWSQFSHKNRIFTSFTLRPPELFVTCIVGTDFHKKSFPMINEPLSVWSTTTTTNRKSHVSTFTSMNFGGTHVILYRNILVPDDKL